MSCEFYKLESSGIFSYDYWCTKNNCRVSDDTYYKYCKDYNYGECPTYKKYAPSTGCFITTITCDILGFSDNHPILNNLREYRNNILQRDPKYNNILKEYDTIGPMIANALFQDNDRKEMALSVLNNCLLPVDSLIKQKKYELAANLYQKMTRCLVSCYGFDEEYEKLKAIDYDYGKFIPTLAGHGRTLKK